jgi:hypothetical protein
MIKKGFVTLVVACALAGTAPSVAAAQASEPANIGVVVYHRTDNPGTLIGRWNFGGRYFGPGLATGGPAEGFAGHYHVRYFMEDGTFSDEYDLEIARSGTFYEVTWRVDGVVKARGIGTPIEDGEGLAVGWHRAE